MVWFTCRCLLNFINETRVQKVVYGSTLASRSWKKRHALNIRRNITEFRALFSKSYAKQSRLVLGIETSCDETGAAIVSENGDVISETLSSQQSIHLRYGGINPPIAYELHQRNIKSVVGETIVKSGVTINDLAAISTTVKPGLGVCLSVGLEYTKELVSLSGKPFIPVHHMEAHALTVRMIEEVNFPFLVLLASGGHCQLALVKDVEDFYLLGSSKDDAPGEAFDKVARRLKLRNIPMFSDMNGGQAIEQIAKTGNPLAFPFTIPMTQYKDCNFSFSGLKSAVLDAILNEEKKYEIEADMILPTLHDICASFQHTVAKHLANRLQRALIYCVQEDLLPQNSKVVLSGGVASNLYIRHVLSYVCDKMKAQLICPPPKFCTDNGIMIAWNGIEKLKKNTGIVENMDDVIIDPKAPLGIDISEKVKRANIKLDNVRINSCIVK